MKWTATIKKAWTRIRKSTAASANAFFNRIGAGGRGHRIQDNPQGYLKAYNGETWTAGCVDFRAKNIGQVPWRLDRVDKDGNLKQEHEHAILDVLRNVNPLNMQGSDLFNLTEVDVNVFGAAFWLLDPVNKASEGQPQEIFRLDPRGIILIPSKEPGEWISRYQYTDPRTGQMIPYNPVNVVRFMHPNPENDLVPLSPLRAILRTIESSIASEIFNLAFFKRGHPGVFLSSDQELTAAQANEARDRFNESVGSLEESHNAAVFGKGVEVKQFGTSPKDADFIKAGPQYMLKICSRLGVNPSLLGFQAVNKATAEIAKIAFWHETGIPELNWFAQVLNDQYVPRFNNSEGLVLSPGLEKIPALQAEWLLKAERLTKATGGVAVLAADEARQRLGLKPKGGEAGVLHIQSSLIPIGGDEGEET